MKIGVNQFCFPACVDIREALSRAADLGFDSFEVCLTAGREGGRASSDVTDALDISGYYNRLCNIDSKEQDFLALGKMAQDAGIKIGSVGGIVSFSVYPLSAIDEGTAQKGMDAVKKMIDAAQVLGADTVLVIPGMLTEEMEYKEAYERVQRRIEILGAYAGDIKLAIENVWNNFLYSPLELCRFVDEIGRKNVGVYFDIANARRFGYPEQWIRTLSHRIMGLHVKDYRMSVDNIDGFTNVLDGDVNYLKVMESLKAVGYDGTMTVELIPPAHFMVDSTLEHARKVCGNLINI